MADENTDMQLMFDFADPNESDVHGEQQIAAPVDNSLLEDDDEQENVVLESPETDPSADLPEEQIENLLEAPEELPDELSEEEPLPEENVQEQPLPEATPAEPPKMVYSEFGGHDLALSETVEQAVPSVEEKKPETVRRRITSASGLQQRDLQCAALGWLATLHPTAAAIRVPTRLAKFRADAAAFWSTPKKNRLLQPEKTILIEARPTRMSCWPECSGSEEILPELRREQEHRQELEAEIRIREPHLRDSDVLFAEIEYWNYEGTSNPAYRECLRRIRSYEKALYRGSRFERIHRANVANELYLAVPEGLIHPDELAEGWGLLYVSRNLKVEVVKTAQWIECPQENMLHLSQNIAASSLHDVLFAHGISLTAGGGVQFHCPPRRRRIRPLI